MVKRGKSARRPASEAASVRKAVSALKAITARDPKMGKTIAKVIRGFERRQVRAG